MNTTSQNYRYLFSKSLTATASNKSKYLKRKQSWLDIDFDISSLIEDPTENSA